MLRSLLLSAAILSLFSQRIFAFQAAPTDSTEFIRIDSIAELTIRYVCRDLEESNRLIAFLKEESKKVDYQKGEALAYKFYGTNKICLGQNDSAVYFLRKSLDIFQSAAEHEQYIRTLNNLAVAFKNQALLDSAALVFEDMIFQSQKHEYKDFESYGSGGKASLYLETGEFDSVVIYGFKSLKIAEELQDSVRMGSALMDIASAYFKNREYENALETYNEALEVLTAIKDEYNLSSLYLNLGNIYGAYEKYDSAILYFERSVEKARKSNNVAVLGFSLQSMGEIFLRQGKFTEAIDYSRMAINKMKQIQNYLNMVEAFNTLSKAYIKTADPDSAVYFAKEALKLTGDNKFAAEKSISYRNLCVAYKQKGDFELALENYELYDSLQNRILNQQKDSVISDLRVRYETEKIEAEKIIASEKAALAEAKNERMTIIVIAVVLLTVLILTSSILYFNRLKQKKKAEMIALELKESQKRLAVEKQYRDSELKALKAQMNPHFIFNVLNSIQEFIVLNQKDMASDYLATFAELIRSYLHYSSEGQISIADEIETLNKYMELESLRFEEKLSYKITLEDDSLQDKFIPTMVIQPFVENAVKHGLFHKPNDQRLSVSIAMHTNTSIKVEIEDNGIGRERAKELKGQKQQMHKSFAMDATQNRLDLLNEKFENKIGLEYIDLKGDNGDVLGTKVVLTIPIL